MLNESCPYRLYGGESRVYMEYNETDRMKTVKLESLKRRTIKEKINNNRKYIILTSGLPLFKCVLRVYTFDGNEWHYNKSWNFNTIEEAENYGESIIYR